MAQSAGAEDQLDLAGSLDDQAGCGFMFLVFLSGIVGGAIFGAVIIFY